MSSAAGGEGLRRCCGEQASSCVRTQQMDRRLVSGFQKSAWRVQASGWRLDLSKKAVGKGCGAGHDPVSSLCLMVLKSLLPLTELWWIGLFLSTYLCPYWYVLGEAYGSEQLKSQHSGLLMGKKTENFCYGLEKCVPFLNILGNNVAAHRNV